MERQAPSRASIFALLLLFGCQDMQREPARLFAAADRPLENRAGLFCYNGKPFSGRLYECAGTDTLYTIGFWEGKENGTWNRYYPGGKLSEQRSFRDGVKTDTLRSWWENGNSKMEYVFAGGEYEGRAREWNREGRLVAEFHYHEGHEAGPQRTWYDDGSVRANYIITGGRRYGLLGTKNCVNVSDSVFRN